jgi:hypothetical protein
MSERVGIITSVMSVMLRPEGEAALFSERSFASLRMTKTVASPEIVLRQHRSLSVTSHPDIILRRRRAPNSLHWRCQALLLQCLIVVTLREVGIQSVTLEVDNNVFDQEGSHQRPLSRREVAAVAYSSSYFPNILLPHAYPLLTSACLFSSRRGNCPQSPGPSARAGRWLPRRDHP